jgi:hypothetical protein
MARPGRAERRRRFNSQGKPLSRFVRGLISAEVYFKLTDQRVKK